MNFNISIWTAQSIALHRNIGLAYQRVLSFSGAQGPQVQKLLERLTGQHTVPNVFIGKFLELAFT